MVTIGGAIVIGGKSYTYSFLIGVLLKIIWIIAIIICATIAIKKIINHEKHKINLLEEQNKILKDIDKKE